jgi:hypothetical protein
MDAAIGSKRVIETDAIIDAITVDEDHDVRPQMPLFIENIATQLRVGGKRIVQCMAQSIRRGVDFRHVGEAAQLLGEDDFWHCKNYDDKVWRWFMFANLLRRCVIQ